MTDQPVIIESEGKAVTEYSKALKHLGYDFRRNILKGEQFRVNEECWQSFKDGDVDNIFLDVENKVLLETIKNNKPVTKPFGVNLTRDRMALSAWFRRNEFNPFTEYLQKLVKRIPDDEGYGGDYEAEYLLSKLFNLDHQGKYKELSVTSDEAEDYTRQNFMRFILGIIDRTLDPGCEFETMPVWVSEQGAGKSVTLSQLLPLEIDGFLRGVSLNLPQRSFVQSCQRGIIIEHMETTTPGGKTATAEQKERISNSSPVLDLKYDKFPSEHPLHHVSIGTTNELEFNTFDPSGDRRINPILLSQRFDDNVIYERLTTIIGEWRDRLWLHALHQYVLGHRGRLGEWSPRNREIRNLLIGVVRKTQTIVDKALHQLLAVPEEYSNGTNNHDRVLNEEEREQGIPFGSSKHPPHLRTIMRLLDPQALRSSNPETIKAVMVEQGWIGFNPTKEGNPFRRIEGKKYRVIKPPPQASNIDSSKTLLSKNGGINFSDGFTR